MIDALRDSIGFACIAVAVVGSLYALVAAALVSRAREEPVPRGRSAPGVTILKPLRGAEPSLEACLESFCAQRYDGPVQLLFGIEDANDPAAGIARKLASRWTVPDIELVVGRTAKGANPKIATLVALESRIAHPIVVLADSDIAVEPDYLSRVVSALGAPGVGLVTCLYRGEPTAGVWSDLAAMTIDYHFTPSVLVGLALRLARPCFGSTIALRRQTLAAIGDFDAFIDHLADDHAIGEAVRGIGMDVALAGTVVKHMCSEASFADLARHELRWARTIRAIDPVGYAASLVTHALPFALIGAAMLGFGAIGIVSVVVALTCRLVLERRVDHTFGSPRKREWLGPIRDVLSFAIHVASFFVQAVTWRGRRYRVRADGTLAAIGDTNP